MCSSDGPNLSNACVCEQMQLCACLPDNALLLQAHPVLVAQHASVTCMLVCACVCLFCVLDNTLPLQALKAQLKRRRIHQMRV